MATEAYIAEYTITDQFRDIRWIERVPVFGQLAESYINLTARDWRRMEITSIVPYDPEVAYNMDMTPYVKFSDNKYHRTYTSLPVIYKN